MGLETAAFIAQLNTAWPDGATDLKSQGDDHLKLIKSALKGSFPNMGQAAFTRITTTIGKTAAVADNWGFWNSSNAGEVYTIVAGTVGANFVLLVRNGSVGVLTVNGVALIPTAGALVFSDGSNVFVFPLYAKTQGLIVKATIDGTNGSLMSGFGIGSTVRNATGDYTINISPAMNTNLYTPMICCSMDSSGTLPMMCNVNQGRTFSASTFSVKTTDRAGILRDVLRLYVQVPGD